MNFICFSNVFSITSTLSFHNSNEAWKDWRGEKLGWQFDARPAPLLFRTTFLTTQRPDIRPTLARHPLSPLVSLQLPVSCLFFSNYEQPPSRLPLSIFPHVSVKLLSFVYFLSTKKFRTKRHYACRPHLILFSKLINNRCFYVLKGFKAFKSQ